MVNFQFVSFRKVHLSTKIVNIGIYHFYMKYTIPKNDINRYKEKQNKRESRSKCLQTGTVVQFRSSELGFYCHTLALFTGLVGWLRAECRVANHLCMSN